MKKYWKFIFFTLTLFSTIVHSQDNKKNKITYQFSHLEDSGNFDAKYQQHQLRIDISKNYISLVTEPIERIRIGRYQKITWNKEKKIAGVFQPEIAFSYNNPGYSFGVKYTHYWKKRIIPYLGVTNYGNGRENIISSENVSILNIGGSTDLSAAWKIGFGIFQDLSEIKNIVTLTSIQYKYKQISIKSYINIGTNSNVGINNQLGYRRFFILGGFNNNIDFSRQQRLNIGAGYKITI